MFVIFDTEYTSWKGCNEKGWVDPQKKEVVQIAAIKIDDNLEVVDSLNLYVKPKFNPDLSEYFQELTKITNQKLDDCGIDFAKAYQIFYNF